MLVAAIQNMIQGMKQLEKDFEFGI